MLQITTINKPKTKQMTAIEQIAKWANKMNWIIIEEKYFADKEIECEMRDNEGNFRMLNAQLTKTGKAKKNSCVISDEKGEIRLNGFSV